MTGFCIIKHILYNYGKIHNSILIKSLFNLKGTLIK